MKEFSKTNAKKIIRQLNLEASNRALADYWLSLWEADKLPARTKLSPSHLGPYLRGILMFDVIPDTRVSVRLAGTGYRIVLGADPTGADWIAAAPEDHRATRLTIFSTVARGAVLVAHRCLTMLDGEVFVSEEILLPFASEPSGTVPILARVNFTESQFMRIKSIPQVTGNPLDHKLISLAETE